MGHVLDSSSNVGLVSLKITRRKIQQGWRLSQRQARTQSTVIRTSLCSRFVQCIFWNSWSHRKMLSLIFKLISGSNTMLGPLRTTRPWRRGGAARRRSGQDHTYHFKLTFSWVWPKHSDWGFDRSIWSYESSCLHKYEDAIANDCKTSVLAVEAQI